MSRGGQSERSRIRRYWIVGHSGSGKSRVAARIAAHLGVEPVHLDEIHWKPGWIESAAEEEIAALEPIISREAWVIEGNYAWLRERFADRVDLFVWLDLPLCVTFPRVLCRTLRRSITNEPCCNGNRESLRRALFHRDSILLWSLRMDRVRRRELERELADHAHRRLRSQRDVDAWIDRLSAPGRA
jgi:adenylate kinase family enzyme